MVQLRDRISVHSLCTTLKELEECLGDRLALVAAEPGETSYRFCISHLQDNGVPPDLRSQTSRHTLSHPATLLVYLVHPGARLATYRNGTVTPFFIPDQDSHGVICLRLFQERIGTSPRPSRARRDTIRLEKFLHYLHEHLSHTPVPSEHSVSYPA